MALDLVPRRWLAFPRWMDWDEEEDNLTLSSPSGLSIYEDNENVYIEAAAPGIDSKDVEITFDKGFLWIKAEKKEEEKEKNKYYRRATSSFSYRVAVPGEIDMTKEPEADVENGLIKVKFPKSEETKPRSIKVKAKNKK